jgi:ABC-type polysaccharide/polyol phosphate export permease
MFLSAFVIQSPQLNAASLTHLNPFVFILRILRGWLLWSEFEGRLTSVCNEIVLLTTILVQWLTLPAL